MKNAVAVKERPILFSGEMVRAILEGRKTQTRRIIKQDLSEHLFGCTHPAIKFFSNAWGCPSCGAFHWTDSLKSRYGNEPGERLWVREKFAVDEMLMDAKKPIGWYWDYFQNCEGRKSWPAHEPLPLKKMKKCNNIPSIFMKRWASRITLEITNIRVERLNDISHKDALSEGVSYDVSVDGGAPLPRFKKLWESINGAGSWEKNPWVWAIEFKKIKGVNL